MVKELPGTTVELDIAQWERADEVFSHIFLTGGLMLSQVAGISGLAPYDIQNWVRRGFLSPPVQKRYSQRQLSRILIISMLRRMMQIDRICALLSYINGDLSDEGDDSIDDTRLYMYLVKLCAEYELGRKAEPLSLLHDYAEPYPGARAKVARVLEVMATVYRSECLMRRAEDMLADLDILDGR